MRKPDFRRIDPGARIVGTEQFVIGFDGKLYYRPVKTGDLFLGFRDGKFLGLRFVQSKQAARKRKPERYLKIPLFEKRPA